MKLKTCLLIMEGFQVALGAIILILATIGFIAHLVMGHLGIIGFLVGAAMWGICYHLFGLAMQDYKSTKNAKIQEED